MSTCGRRVRRAAAAASNMCISGKDDAAITSAGNAAISSRRPRIRGPWAIVRSVSLPGRRNRQNGPCSRRTMPLRRLSTWKRRMRTPWSSSQPTGIRGRRRLKNASPL